MEEKAGHQRKERQHQGRPARAPAQQQGDAPHQLNQQTDADGHGGHGHAHRPGIAHSSGKAADLAEPGRDEQKSHQDAPDQRKDVLRRIPHHVACS
jgi:hypothetical protein